MKTVVIVFFSLVIISAALPNLRKQLIHKSNRFNDYFKKIDIDNNGKLSSAEMMAFRTKMVKLINMIVDKKVGPVFDKVDQDGDSCLNLEDVEKLVVELDKIESSDPIFLRRRRNAITEKEIICKGDYLSLVKEFALFILDMSHEMAVFHNFNTYDTDDDGELSLEEAKAGLNTEMAVLTYF